MAENNIQDPPKKYRNPRSGNVATEAEVLTRVSKEKLKELVDAGALEEVTDEKKKPISSGGSGRPSPLSSLMGQRTPPQATNTSSSDGSGEPAPAPQPPAPAPTPQPQPQVTPKPAQPEPATPKPPTGAPLQLVGDDFGKIPAPVSEPETEPKTNYPLQLVGPDFGKMPPPTKASEYAAQQEPKTDSTPAVKSLEEIRAQVDKLYGRKPASDIGAMGALLEQSAINTTANMQRGERLTEVQRGVLQTMANEPEKYYKIDRPALEEFPRKPDASYRQLRTEWNSASDWKAPIDELIANTKNPDGTPLSSRDQQELRNRIVNQTESSRNAFDLLQKAKKNYRIGGTDEPEKKVKDITSQLDYLTPGGWARKFKSWLSTDTKEEPAPKPLSGTPLLDKYGQPTDPLTLESENQIQAMTEGKAKVEDLKTLFDNQFTSLQLAVNDGKLTPDQANRKLNETRRALEGMETYVQDRTRQLNKRVGIPAVFQAEIDAVQKEQKQYAEGSIRWEMYQKRLDKLREKQQTGEYSDDEGETDDKNWNRAMALGFKDQLIEKNERAKVMFNNRDIDNKYVSGRTPFRRERNFLAKQLTGLFQGVGSVEQMAGGLMNMMGAYTIGNKVTENGKHFIEANDIPMPIDKNGNQQIIDDDASTWIARNVSAQAPLAAALMVTGNYAGGAIAPMLEGLGLTAKTAAFLQGAAGGAITVIPESLMEKSSTYTDAIAQGKSMAEAERMSEEVFYENIILGSFTNPLEFGLYKLPMHHIRGGELLKSGIEAATNGIQEVGQNWFQEKQNNPALGILDYATTPEGISAGLSGAAVGVLQNAFMGKLQDWQANKLTNKLYNFNNMYKSAGKPIDPNVTRLPSNQTIANTVRQSFLLSDTPNRQKNLHKVIDRLQQSGAYTKEEAGLVNSIIEDVAAVKDQVPAYATPEQQTAIFNALLEIRTNNKLRDASGTKEAADKVEADNKQWVDKIGNVLAGKEPLYFMNGNETTKEQMEAAVDILEKIGGLTSKSVRISVSNDEAFADSLVERVEAAKKKEAADIAARKAAKKAAKKAPKKPATPATPPSPAATSSAVVEQAEATQTPLDKELQAELESMEGEDEYEPDEEIQEPEITGSSKGNPEEISQPVELSINTPETEAAAAAPVLESTNTTPPAAPAAPVEVINYSTPEDQTTTFGKPETVFKSNQTVGQSYAIYDSRVQRSGGAEDFEAFSNQTKDYLRSEFSRAGISPDLVTDDVRDNFLSEFYDEAGLDANEQKSMAQVTGNFIKNYEGQQPAAPSIQSAESAQPAAPATPATPATPAQAAGLTEGQRISFKAANQEDLNGTVIDVPGLENMDLVAVTKGKTRIYDLVSGAIVGEGATRQRAIDEAASNADKLKDSYEKIRARDSDRTKSSITRNAEASPKYQQYLRDYESGRNELPDLYSVAEKAALNDAVEEARTKLGSEDPTTKRIAEMVERATASKEDGSGKAPIKIKPESLRQAIEARIPEKEKQEKQSAGEPLPENMRENYGSNITDFVDFVNIGRKRRDVLEDIPIVMVTGFYNSFRKMQAIDQKYGYRKYPDHFDMVYGIVRFKNGQAKGDKTLMGAELAKINQIREAIDENYKLENMPDFQPATSSEVKAMLDAIDQTKAEASAATKAEKKAAKKPPAFSKMRDTYDKSGERESEQSEWGSEAPARKFRDDLTAFSKALAAKLGWQPGTNRKGKVEWARVNIPPAGGEGSFTLFPDNDSDTGVYVEFKANRGDDDETLELADSVLVRTVERGTSKSGINQWVNLEDATVDGLATKLEAMAAKFAPKTEPKSEPASPAIPKTEKVTGSSPTPASTPVEQTTAGDTADSTPKADGGTKATTGDAGNVRDTKPAEQAAEKKDVKADKKAERQARRERARQEVDDELDDAVAELSRKLKKSIKGSSGVDPIEAAQVTAQALKVVGIYVKKNVLKFRDIIEKFLDRFGPETLTDDMQKALRNAYASQRQDDEEREDDYNTDKEIRAFMKNELPDMIAEALEDEMDDADAAEAEAEQTEAEAEPVEETKPEKPKKLTKSEQYDAVTDEQVREKLAEDTSRMGKRMLYGWDIVKKALADHPGLSFDRGPVWKTIVSATMQAQVRLKSLAVGTHPNGQKLTTKDIDKTHEEIETAIAIVEGYNDGSLQRDLAGDQTAEPTETTEPETAEPETEPVSEPESAPDLPPAREVGTSYSLGGAKGILQKIVRTPEGVDYELYQSGQAGKIRVYDHPNGSTVSFKNIGNYEVARRQFETLTANLQQAVPSSNGRSTDTGLSDTLRTPEAGVDGSAQPAGSAEPVQVGATEGLPDSGSEQSGGRVPEVEGSEPGTDARGSEGDRGSGSDSTGASGSTGTKTGKRKRDGRNQEKSNRVIPENPADRNHIISETDVIVPSGNVAKFTGNMDAIMMLRTLEKENRNATPEEKKVLAQFVGWGGLASYLDNRSYFYSEDQSIVNGLLNGGKFLVYRGGRQELDIPRIDQTGMNFEQLVSAVQRGYSKFVADNNLDNSVQNTRYSPDDLRKMMVRNLLSKEELGKAQGSTLNAHYTERSIINAMWDMAKQFGFKGGNVLESSAGIGHFFGLMPQELQEASNLTGVELDNLTGRILKKLYPDGNMINKGFQYVHPRPNSFDLAIGNVPFSRTGVTDAKNLDIDRFNLHNYFIAKNLKLLKPGGMAIMISTSNTMDRAGSMEARNWFASPTGGNSELIGAIRLPNNAFEENAGTQVTTDILIFRKRTDSNPSAPNPFAQIVNIRSREGVDDNGNPEAQVIRINEYFVKNPQNMIGEMMFADEVGRGGLRSSADSTLQMKPGTDVNARVREIMATFPTDIFGRKDDVPEEVVPETISSTEREGRMFVQDGKLYTSTGDEAEQVVLDKDLHKVAVDYVPLRNVVQNLISAEQSADATDEQIEDARRVLNSEYDQFVSKHGSLMKNDWLTDHDVEFPLVGAIEDHISQTKVSAKGRITRTYRAVKGKIFSERLNFPRAEPRTAENLSDAIKISNAYRGKIDDKYIASLVGSDPESVREDMLADGLVFEDPTTGLLQVPAEYLSGYVRDKLVAARNAAEENPEFLRNVRELEKVVPTEIAYPGINYKIGVNYIPAPVYRDFIKQTLGIDAEVIYLETSGRWAIKPTGGMWDTRNKSAYKVDKYDGIQILAATMNSKVLKIVDEIELPDGSTRKVDDEAATQAIQDMQDKFTDEFRRFIKNNDTYRDNLVRDYNQLMRNYVERKQELPDYKYFPGASHEVELREHQILAVLRALQNNTLLAHGVGTGKTYTLITIAMEMRRLGLAKKPMIVVKNSTLSSFARDFKKLYPGARILVETDKVDAEKRKRFFAQAAVGDWDAVIVPQSWIDKIPDRPDRVENFIQSQIDAVREAYANMSEQDQKGYAGQALLNQIEDYEDEIAKLYTEEYDEEGNLIEKEKDSDAGEGKKKKGKSVKDDAEAANAIRNRVEQQANRRTDKVMYFDDMNVDALLVDESHAYKKLGFQTAKQNIKGIDTKKSQRSMGVLLKIESVNERTGGKNAVFATGTPVTNTLAEAWTILRFLNPTLLKKMGITHFDQFVNSFASVNIVADVNAAGNMKLVSRLNMFFNLPEFLRAFRSVSDVVFAEDVKEFKEDPTKAPPLIKGGRPELVISEQSNTVRAMLRRFAAEFRRYEDMSGAGKKANSHMPLVLYKLGMYAAIDTRLVDPMSADDPNSKVNVAIKRAMEIYHQEGENKGTQMFFSDTINSIKTIRMKEVAGLVGDRGKFDLYKDIRNKLIAQGVPASEIVIVNDPKYSDPEKLGLAQEAMREGKVRFMIGSTEKMGIGINVQDRLFAVHHLDVVDRPDKFEQRNGRIIRQGNLYRAMGKEVEVIVYGTKGTRDSAGYGRLQQKQLGITQLLKGKMEGREMEDVSADDDANAAEDFYGEVGAELTGSRTAMDLKLAERDLRKEKLRAENFDTRKEDVAKRITARENTLRQLKGDRLKQAEKNDAMLAKSFPNDSHNINTISIDGVEIAPDNFTKAVNDAIADLRAQVVADNRSNPKKIIEVNGLPVEVDALNTLGNPTVRMANKEFQIAKMLGAESYQSFRGTLIAQISNLESVEGVQQKIAGTEKEIAQLEKDLETDVFDPAKLESVQAKVNDLKARLLEETNRAAEAEKAAYEEEQKQQQIANNKLQRVPEEYDESWEASNPEQELDKTVGEINEEARKTAPPSSDNGNMIFSGPGYLFMNLLPRVTKAAYLAMRTGIRTVSQFAKRIGHRISPVVVKAWNAAKKPFKLKHRVHGMKQAPSMANVAVPPPPPPSPTTPLTRGRKIREMRDRARKIYDNMLVEFQRQMFGSEDIGDADFSGYKNPIATALDMHNKLQDRASKAVFGKVSKGLQQLQGKMLSNQNKIWGGLARGFGKAINSIFKGLGSSVEDMQSAEKMLGSGKVRSVEDSLYINRVLRKLIGNDKASLMRIDQVLDPEKYKQYTFDEFEIMIANGMTPQEFSALTVMDKIQRYAVYRDKLGFDKPGYKMHTEADLSAPELTVYKAIRFMYDMMHEINFAMGKLTPETYERNKGVYSARLYDYYEIPLDARAMFGDGGIKLDESLYSQRGELTEWKLVNGLSDPIFASSKRLAQTMSNKAIIDYADYLVKKRPDVVSPTPMAGYRRLGSGYGALSRQYVRDEVAEDLIGHFYNNVHIQGIYNAFKAYDRLDIRQMYKEIFTVWNPGVHVGNVMGNVMFASFAGISTYRLTKNVKWALEQVQQYTPEYRYMLSSGLLQSEFTRDQLLTGISKLEEVNGKAAFSFPEKVRRFYTRTDDVFKMAAFKSLLETGYTPKQADQMVKEAFQNYQRVGSAYSVASKIPLIGPPFGGFAGNLTKIVKNAMMRRPLQVMGMLYLARAVELLFSRWSGESEEERKKRHNRLGAVKVPFFSLGGLKLGGVDLGGDVSLEYYINFHKLLKSWGIDNNWSDNSHVINAARIIAPMYLYGSADGNDAFETANKFSPLPINLTDWTSNPGGEYAVNLQKAVQDPLFQGFASLITNSDFLGKPVYDPKETKKKRSTLTDGEKAENATRYLWRTLGGQYTTTADDLWRVMHNEPDYYGRTRTPGQILMQFLTGLKVSTFNDDKYSKILSDEIDAYGYDFREEAAVLSTLKTQFKRGEIDRETYERRSEGPKIKMAEIVEEAQAKYQEFTGKMKSLDLRKEDVLKPHRKRGDFDLPEVPMPQQPKLPEY